VTTLQVQSFAAKLFNYVSTDTTQKRTLYGDSALLQPPAFSSHPLHRPRGRSTQRRAPAEAHLHQLNGSTVSTKGTPQGLSNKGLKPDSQGGCIWLVARKLVR